MMIKTEAMLALDKALEERGIKQGDKPKPKTKLIKKKDRKK